jgi:DNA-binding transcriptional MerR regulator
MPEDDIRRLYYSISEIGELCGTKPHVLRYWETEFRQLKPKKNRAGRRVYTQADLEVIQKIVHLLRVEKYTIEGARQVLEDGYDVPDYVEPGTRETLEQMRTFLEKVLQQL